MKAEDAAQYSSHNNFLITADRGGSKKHGCYFCVSIVEREDITEWWDNGQTAVCPRCGVDAILPYTTDEDFLAECSEHWFTGRLERYNGGIIKELEQESFDTLKKLKILETHKNIYNIHYCQAGVGIVFFYPDKVKGDQAEDWKKALNCKRYYKTFDECIAAEYAELNISPTSDDDIIRTEDLAVSLSPILNSAPVYEYKYSRADTVVTLGIEVNNNVAKRWEVDGDMVVGHRDLSDVYIQRMRREKE